MDTRFRSLWLASAILALSGGVAALQTQQTDIDRDLEEAKTLYREARFSDAVVSLQTTIGRLKVLENLQARKADLADAYLYLGLSYFALAELDAAKEQLRNVLSVDPNRRLDPQVYAPAVVKLFEEARLERSEGQAQAVSPTAPRPGPSASASEKMSGSKIPLFLGGAAVGGAGVALARGASGGSTSAPTAVATPTPATATPEPGLSPRYDIAFLGSDPPPGSTIRMGAAGGTSILNLRIQVSAVANRTSTFRVYAADLNTAGRQCICGSSVHQFTSGQPVTGIEVALNYPCGDILGPRCPGLPYTTSALYISLVDQGDRTPQGGFVAYVEEFGLAYTLTR